MALCLGLPACTATATLPESGTARRRPDGVAIDPISAPPPARDRADVAEGLVTLRTPLGIDRALSTVQELFRKIVQEDGEGLEPLFTRDALAVTSLAPSGAGQTPQAILFWHGRFRKLDYTRLAGELVYRDAEITFFRAEDALDAPPHPAIRADALNGNDVVVRVPIVMARVGADRLFGDEMILWLRRDGDRYRIYRIFEDFQLN
ncbi:Hypothetical protein A7982_04293 [Minicystis rosea]|nr:Hypothetical protein A7982_04293 [Minicystis rosea]